MYPNKCYNQTMYGPAPLELCDVVEDIILKLCKQRSVTDRELCADFCQKHNITHEKFCDLLYQNKINFKCSRKTKTWWFEMYQPQQYPDFVEC